MLPIGGYKGYGIAAMGEVLCGVLTGMGFGRSIPPCSPRYGKTSSPWPVLHVMRVDVCQSQTDFESRLQQMTDEVRSEPHMPDEHVQLANDPQIKEAKFRKNEGIPIDDSLWAEFQKLSSDLNVAMIEYPRK